VVRGKSVEPFHYRDKGTLATIGRAAAVAEIGELRLSGFVVTSSTWFGFRRRFIVMAEWAWLYLRNERGARLTSGDVGTRVIAIGRA
jgi:NADH dehydrogenase